jgi:uncharacterized membrane protein YdjX (TVP38/TMEM64 family)
MQAEPSSARQSTMRRLGAAGPVAVLLSFAPPLGGFVLLATLTWLGGWFRMHETSGWIVYLVCVGLLIGVSFVPTFSCGILAGWAFGFAIGWPLAIAAVTAGAFLAYAIGRAIARDRVIKLVREKPKLRAVHDALLARHGRRTLMVVILVRIPPASPFALTNFLFAAMRVPLADYTLGTLAGIVPRMALTVFVGAGLERLRFQNVLDPWMIVAGTVAGGAVCLVLGVLANRALRQITSTPGRSGESGEVTAAGSR